MGDRGTLTYEDCLEFFDEYLYIQKKLEVTGDGK